MRRLDWPRHVPQQDMHDPPQMPTIEDDCDNLDKWVSRDCIRDIWTNAPKSMIQESDEETSDEVPKPEVDA